MAEFAERFINAYGAGQKAQRDDTVRSNAYAASQGDESARQAVYGADPQAGFSMDEHFAKMDEAKFMQQERGLKHTRDLLYPLTQAKPEQFQAMLAEAKQRAHALGVPDTTTAMINTPDDVARAWQNASTYEMGLAQQKAALDERKIKEDERTGVAQRDLYGAQAEHARASAEKDRASATATTATSWTEDAINLAVDQRLAGDTAAFSNAGRGLAGQQVVARLRNRLAEVARERHLQGAQIAAIDKELSAYGTAVRATATRAAGIKMAGNEFLRVAPQVEDALKGVPATRLTDLNALLNAWNTHTGDPGIVRLGGALNAAINTYARAISPQGVPTVHDKEEGIKIISTWMAKGQVLGAMDQMKLEIKAALKSPEDTRHQLHDEFLSRFGIATAPRPVDGDIYAPETEDDYNQLPSGARYVRPGEKQTRIKP